MSKGTLNKVMLIGHLGDGVKMHYFEGGGCVGRFPLATNEDYTNKSSGDKVTNTEWHNIVLRNKAAEICEKYLIEHVKIPKQLAKKRTFDFSNPRFTSLYHKNSSNRTDFY